MSLPRSCFNQQILYWDCVDSIYRKTRCPEIIGQDPFRLNACEYFLSKTLRKSCDHKGKEVNTAKTAQIIRDMAQVYKLRSPNKVDLIKSAVLLNAAIIRCNENTHFVEELMELGCHVLTLAGAKNKSADLREPAELCKENFSQLRQTVKNDLGKLKNTNEITEPLRETAEKETCLLNLQHTVSETYSKAMAEIMNFCVEVLGEPPCEYALAAMGSLAKNEITPYSDFENFIILQDGVQFLENYEQIVEYFRWAAVLFQIILVNMGETIIRFMDISSIKDWIFDAHTPCGVCPDGFAPAAGKNPLGRQQLTTRKPWVTELIKPVTEMLKYCKAREAIKNGYHLADMLTKTAFVSGNRTLYSRYHTESLKLVGELNKTDELINSTKDDVKNSIINKFPFDQDFKNFDVKRIIYRSTTLFLSTIGRHLELTSLSSFEIVDDLEKKELICTEFAARLRFAVCVATETRLRYYSDKMGQNDFLPNTKTGRSSLLQLLGENVAVLYYETAYDLQSFMLDLMGLSGLKLFDDNERKPYILYSLSLFEKALDSCREMGWLELSSEENLSKNSKLLVGLCYKKLRNFKLGLTYLIDAEKEIVSFKEPSDYLHIQCLLALSNCYEMLGDVKNCMDYLMRASAITRRYGIPKLKSLMLGRKNEYDDPLPESHYSIAEMLHMFGSINALADKERGFGFLHRELELRKQLTDDWTKDKKTGKCYLTIAECHLSGHHDYQTSLKYLTTANAILTSCQTKCKTLFRVKTHLGTCHLQLGRANEALPCFLEALQLRLEIPEGHKTILTLGECYFNVAITSNILKKYETAISHFQLAKSAYATSPNPFVREQLAGACDKIIKSIQLTLGIME